MITHVPCAHCLIKRRREKQILLRMQRNRNDGRAMPTEVAQVFVVMEREVPKRVVPVALILRRCDHEIRMVGACDQIYAVLLGEQELSLLARLHRVHANRLVVRRRDEALAVARKVKPVDHVRIVSEDLHQGETPHGGVVERHRSHRT
eukprot:Amastigsp_a339640_42.p3 type:complete len:148 gc:universal Amastigsp_a339640_42:490-47(-)